MATAAEAQRSQQTFAGRWHAASTADPELGHLAVASTVSFAVRAGEDELAAFGFQDGRLVEAAPADFELVATAEDWDRFFEAVPRPPYQNFFGMLMRVPGTKVLGDEVRFAQHAHLVRRVLEIGRRVRSGQAPAGAPSGERTESAPPAPDALAGGYHQIEVAGQSLQVFCDQSGAGRDVLFLHTAGADARQFHRLMNDPRLLDRCRMVAFDLPWHGRSLPPPGAAPGSHELDTDTYAETVMAVVDALGLDRPVVVGSSMGGEICLELAYRYPDRIGGVVACEASDHVPGRQVPWARHPLVNQALFVPEWVDGLMAPQSPAEFRREVWWGYSQGGFGTFFGDICFYSGDWDGRDRVAGIDTARCPVVMLTGEYDYSCTPEMSRQTAARIPGAVFREMPELGHFPMTENPPVFAGHLQQALDEIDGSKS